MDVLPSFFVFSPTHNGFCVEVKDLTFQYKKPETDVSCKWILYAPLISSIADFKWFLRKQETIVTRDCDDAVTSPIGIHVIDNNEEEASAVTRSYVLQRSSQQLPPQYKDYVARGWFVEPSKKRMYRQVHSVSNHESLCKNCDPQFATYATHVEYEFKNMLGTSMQFCEGLWHIAELPEFAITARECLYKNNTGQKCRGQSNVIVVRLGTFLARYTNCNHKHAEAFLVEDANLLLYLDQLQTKETLTVYSKFQPCHHSGGNAGKHPNKQYRDDPRSCSELLRAFYMRVLQSKQVTLQVKCAGIYKANWQFCVRPDDIRTKQLAVNGIRLLLETGIRVDAFQKEDWLFLAGMCSEQVSVVTPNRSTMDMGVAAFLHTFQQ